MFHEDIWSISYRKYIKTKFLFSNNIAKNLIWTTLKAILSVFGFFFAPSNYIFSNSISAKAYLFIFQIMCKSQFWKINT